MLEQEGKEWKDEAGVLTGLALGSCNRFPHIQLVGWRPNWKQTTVALAHAEQNLSPTQDVAQMWARVTSPEGIQGNITSLISMYLTCSFHSIFAEVVPWVHVWLQLVKKNCIYPLFFFFFSPWLLCDSILEICNFLKQNAWGHLHHDHANTCVNILLSNNTFFCVGVWLWNSDLYCICVCISFIRDTERKSLH